ncbi:lipid-A-disaccharide synthase [Phycisphaera mikurensis]|uniref:lipid-A-disaccharide synthase n=1 Tax=Phycisphaera mikurensis TaxID=547188 RepID=UPI00059CDE15|nr:hypothetical protein [Phycisphaera mikurensis]MBB6441668.1 lipid-A-disaccharide synthase [Phycisphaera mikurensis]
MCPSDEPGPAKRVLLTVFEPSGDVLAARLVRELRQRRPGWRFFGLGGPRMAEAGVELLEETVGHAAMGVGTGVVREGRELLRRKKLVRDWLGGEPLDLLIPCDAPAANWSFCNLVRKRQPRAKIVHLVCPQVWAWASWRVRRLQRGSDLVLCLLPFEPAWLAAHGVRGVFVGHPLFEDAALEPRPASAAADLPAGGLKLAFLPGSRSSEVQKNWPDMLEIFERLRHRHPDLVVGVAAASRERAEQLRRSSPGGRLPTRMGLAVGDASAVLDWADAAVVVSGTATLEAASRGCPHVIAYRAGPEWLWKLLAPALIRTRTFGLPNLLAERLGVVGDAETVAAARIGRGVGPADRLVPEFVPHFGGTTEIADALRPLLEPGSPAAQRQRDGFARIREAFASVGFAAAACEALLGVVEAGADPPEELVDADEQPR